MIKKYLVTGGAGFIGSHLVDELIKEEAEVVVIDNLSSGNLRNLKQHEGNPSLIFSKKNIQDPSIESLFEGVDTVFHIAAIPRVQYSIKNPIKTKETNIDGTINILQAAKKNNVRRFVFTSSSSVYGDQDQLPFDENMKPNPMSPYALQKLFGEYLCKIEHSIYGLETICLRYFNVYGPRQNPISGYSCLIPKSIFKILNNESPIIHGDGEQTRDFTYIEDVVKANILASKTENEKAFGEVFNIGNGMNLSVNSVVGELINGHAIQVRHIAPVIEPRNTFADSGKAKQLLNWQASVPFNEGIKKTQTWFKKNQTFFTEEVKMFNL